MQTLNCKKDFPILKDNLVYLDNAATSQKPREVIEAIKEFYEKENANAHRGIYKLANKATEVYEEARKIIARFINAEPEEIIFTSGTTESINLLAQILEDHIKEGEKIVITELEHHSNIIPWQELARRKKAILEYISIKKNYELDIEKAKKIIDKKTRIVSIAHVSNTIGTILPIEEIEQLAHKQKAFFIIDGAQSIPHLKIDVKKENIDFLAFSGHKILGPLGIGILYGKKELLKRMQPKRFGGGMIKEVTKEKAIWAEIPHCFEAGTPKIAEAKGLAVAILYLEKQGMENIEEYEHNLTRYALGKLKEIKNLKIIGPETTNQRLGVISFTMKGIHPHDIAEILDKENIAIRAGHHCTQPLHKKLKLESTARISIYLYNTKEDINKLIESLKKVEGVFSK